MTLAFFATCMVWSISCVNANNSSSANGRDLLKMEQQSNRIVIGLDNGRTLEYIDTSKVSDRSTMTIIASNDRLRSTKDVEISIGNKSYLSSDGEWEVSCEGSRCTLIEPGREGHELTISRKGILTPAHLSPDQRLIFFIREAPPFRLPIRCSLADERDVIVYDLSSGRGGIAETVCGGFPYANLKWYTLSSG